MFAVIIASGIAFTCTPVAVWDGDGPIWCAEGPRVRLEAIAAREMDGTCSRGHPCPSVSAEASKRHLAELTGRITGTRSEGHYLVEGPPLRCEAAGTSYERVVARCSSPRWGDLSCRMVRDGYALEWRRYGRACLDDR